MPWHITSIKNQIAYVATTPPGSGAQLPIGRVWAAPRLPSTGRGVARGAVVQEKPAGLPQPAGQGEHQQGQGRADCAFDEVGDKNGTAPFWSSNNL